MQLNAQQSIYKSFFVFFLLVVFASGAFVCLNGGIQYNILSDDDESFDNQDSSKFEIATGDINCPTALIRKGNKLMLYNRNAPEQEGSNPLPFNSMDGYINYLETQRKNNNECPVLYLQQETDIQGNDVMRIRPSPFDLNAGTPTVPIVYGKNVDSSLDNPPYNQGEYAGFDPTSQNVGFPNDLDKIHNSTRLNPISDNPMDPNWGGVIYTQQAVASGKYNDNTVMKVMYPNLSPK